MKKIIFFPLPFWVVILLVFGMGIGMLFVFSLVRPTVLNYSLSLPPNEKKTAPAFSYGEQPALSNPDFFRKVKNDFISQKANFVEADLSLMKLFVYKEGNLSVEFPILTKGKEGSWWETPAGIYKIASKEKNHFSTFGHVYQPWSMAFQGNFFIHGWPYYEDGTPVSSTYSGGCIRLSDESAQTVFDMVKVGMPVLVFKEEFTPDSFVYQTRVPDISTQKYLAADIKNNFVFLEKGQTDRIPFSSFSEVLGSLVATDYINIEKNIRLDQNILFGVSDTRLLSETETTPFDLLHLFLLQSNDAPMRIFANYLSKKRFVSFMKDKALSLGMKNTSFSFNEPSSYTTPEDLFYLSKYLYHNRKFIFEISAGKRTNGAYAKSKWSDIENQNLFAKEPFFVGGKAITNADGTESFFGVFEIHTASEIRPVFIFLGNGTNSQENVLKIREYLQNSYR
ncbi:MAG: L,D-transpeptidase family protein [Candidatus Parcubacteria bacterium]|nr:L,D-transpeptidase family protein [Candidatus Parcubacteria bacterium]